MSKKGGIIEKGGAQTGSLEPSIYREGKKKRVGEGRGQRAYGRSAFHRQLLDQGLGGSDRSDTRVPLL